MGFGLATARAGRASSWARARSRSTACGSPRRGGGRWQNDEAHLAGTG